MASKGVIIWRGDLGNPESHYSKSQVSEVIDAAALLALQTSLLAFVDCNAAKRSFVASYIGTDSAPAAGANVDRKAVCYFRDPDTLKVHSVTLPAPKSTTVEDTVQGERVTPGSMTAIVAAINTATGKSYTPLYGKVIQKK